MTAKLKIKHLAHKLFPMIYFLYFIFVFIFIILFYFYIFKMYFLTLQLPVVIRIKIVVRNLGHNHQKSILLLKQLLCYMKCIKHEKRIGILILVQETQLQHEVTMKNELLHKFMKDRELEDLYSAPQRTDEDSNSWGR